MIKYAYIFIFIFNNMANAADHLEPEESQFSGLLHTPEEGYIPKTMIFSGYEWEVIMTFREVYKDNIKARAIVIPSFQPEYAIGIAQEETGFVIFHLSIKEQLWGQTISPRKNRTKNKPANLQNAENTKNHELNRCIRSLDTPIAEKIENIWRSMLYGTRFSKTSGGGLDGTNYHFSMREEYQDLYGQTWSPNKLSKPGMLVSITDEMVRYCNDKKVTTEELSWKVQALYQALKIAE
ncbi:MAG: hypothetical protein L3J50_13780 [Emcibacter sp.]|nr:hypothetical protein [Emcibacter sp.]